MRRHPHVFGDVEADDAGTVVANWDDIKRAEKGRTSVFDGVARSLPALAYAQQLMAQGGQGRLRLARRRRAAGQGRRGARPSCARRSPAATRTRIADELGDVVIAVVNVARHTGVDAELAVRAAGGKFRRRFEAVEALAAERGIDLRAAGLATLDALWDEVKAAER